MTTGGATRKRGPMRDKKNPATGRERNNIDRVNNTTSTRVGETIARGLYKTVARR